MKEQAISPATFQRRENIVNLARENARGNHSFPEIHTAAARDTQRVRKLLGSVGSNLADEVKGLSPGEQSHFVADLGDRYREHVSAERRNNLFLGRLLRNSTIPLAAINPDGTFNVEKFQTETYFQENPHMVAVLDLHTRQLSEKSKMRQRASKALQNIDEHHDHPHNHDHHDHGHSHAKSLFRIPTDRAGAEENLYLATFRGVQSIAAPDMHDTESLATATTIHDLRNTYGIADIEARLSPRQQQKLAALDSLQQATLLTQFAQNYDSLPQSPDDHDGACAHEGKVENGIDKLLKPFAKTLASEKAQGILDKVKKSAALTVCFFDCQFPAIVQAVGPLFGTFAQVGQHEEIPAVLTNRPRMLHGRRTEEGDFVGTIELPSLHQADAGSVPQKAGDEEDYRIDDVIT
ncbi:MAG: hypothetical protein ACREHC_06070, partial [Candidatus Levyibacteriota bacterium]